MRLETAFPGKVKSKKMIFGHIECIGGLGKTHCPGVLSIKGIGTGRFFYGGKNQKTKKFFLDKFGCLGG